MMFSPLLAGLTIQSVLVIIAKNASSVKLGTFILSLFTWVLDELPDHMNFLSLMNSTSNQSSNFDHFLPTKHCKSPNCPAFLPRKPFICVAVKIFKINFMLQVAHREAVNYRTGDSDGTWKTTDESFPKKN